MKKVLQKAHTVSLALSRHKHVANLRRHVRSRAIPVVIAIAFIIAGGIFIVQSRAATYAVSKEAEAGTLGGNAKPVTGAAASNAQAVQFGIATPPAAPVLIAAAGDIAGEKGKVGGEMMTGDLIRADASINTVLALGDLAYDSGTASEFTNKYGPAWGSFKNKTKPTPGNHEYITSGAGPYFSYFNNPPEYYSFELGAWHIMSMNSEIDHSAGDEQLIWAKKDLAAHPKQCILAYWHTPRYSGGSHGDDSSLADFWDVLYAAGADVVLNGHSHTYERVAPSNPNNGVDRAKGIQQFVVGTGGASLGSGSSTQATYDFKDSNDYGILKMNLSPAGYDYKFVIKGGVVKDQGNASCHNTK